MSQRRGVEAIRKARPFIHELHLQDWIENIVEIRKTMYISVQTLLRAQIVFVRALLNERFCFDEEMLDILWIVCLRLQFKICEGYEDDLISSGSIPDHQILSCVNALCFLRLLEKDSEHKRQCTFRELNKVELALLEASDWNVYLGVTSAFELLPEDCSKLAMYQLERYMEYWLLPREKTTETIQDPGGWLERLVSHLDPDFRMPPLLVKQPTTPVKEQPSALAQVRTPPPPEHNQDHVLLTNHGNNKRKSPPVNSGRFNSANRFVFRRLF